MGSGGGGCLKTQCVVLSLHRGVTAAEGAAEGAESSRDKLTQRSKVQHAEREQTRHGKTCITEIYGCVTTPTVCLFTQEVEMQMRLPDAPPQILEQESTSVGEQTNHPVIKSRTAPARRSGKSLPLRPDGLQTLASSFWLSCPVTWTRAPSSRTGPLPV